MNLEDIKQFLRVDGSEDDTLIQGFQLAAEEYLSNAGVNKDYTKELYKLAIKLLVGHWFDNRAVVGTNAKLSFSLETIITQLKFTQVDVITP